MARTVAVVPHTHWDREWYDPFPAFRMRLVDVLDELFPTLERQPAYRRFLLDGQMAALDDYLAVRPDAAPLVRRLAGAGRLALGPWYVLMDEFGVSGETIVRNLQLGRERAVAFGGAMPVGYLPDMFGHVAQMPQLLRQAGIEHAVVWRGVPGAITRTGFWWKAPDGSMVRAEYLPTGYGNGAHLPREPAALVRRVRAHELEVGAFLAGDTDPLLLMNGTDHQAPQPWLPQLLDGANAAQEDFHFEIQSLAEYLASAPTEALPSWTGELRSSARANLLMGVLSNRVDVKIAAARAERALERRAEPLAALWFPAERWPATLLDGAWLEVIRNSAHDSICACSADAVVDAVLHRYGEATTVADGLAARSLSHAAALVDWNGPLVVNPTPAARAGVIELDLPGDGAVEGSQVLASSAEGETERSGVGADLARILGELTENGWLDDGTPVDAAVTSTPDGVTLILDADRCRAPEPTAAAVMGEAWAQAGAHSVGTLRVRARRRASQRVAVRTPEVPGYGWAGWSAGALDVPPVRAGDGWLDNDRVQLRVSPADGTFSYNGLSGLDLLVDDGDAGDTYNYSPPPADAVIDRPGSVRVETIESGPVRGRLRVFRQFRWPASLRGGARFGDAPVEVVTDISLHAGEGLVRVHTRFENRSRDHRVRAWFPLAERTDHSVAECAFATVRRGLSAEGGPGERGLATFPARRFVQAGGLTITHEGLLEYEVLEGGTILALTLLRATGILSQAAPAYRPNAAGPAHPLEGPQMIGPVSLRYAVALGDVDPYAMADQVWSPLEVVASRRGGPLPPRGCHLKVSGGVVSSLRRVAGGRELRVFNPSEDATVISVAGGSGWLVDLRGQSADRWAGSFALEPWAIATARLDQA